MDAVVQEKMIRILKSELKYTSSNLAFNMMIAKLQKRLKSDPACIEECIGELEGFLAKYPIVAKVDLANKVAL